MRLLLLDLSRQRHSFCTAQHFGRGQNGGIHGVNMAHSGPILTSELRWNNGVLEQKWSGRGGIGPEEWRAVPTKAWRVCGCAIGGLCKDHKDQCEYPQERS